jgi:hypothetical protein
LVEHCPYKAVVEGSSLSAPTKRKYMRPTWLKEEFKFVVYQKNSDDEYDPFITYLKTEKEAQEYCGHEIAAYKDVPEFQFYYKEVL